MPAKACLYHSIGLCPAPCVGAISKKDYGRNIKNIKLVLEGRKDELYRNLKEDMERLAQNKDFEQAALLRDQLRAIGALYSSSPDANYFKELEQLERALGLPRRPERIECIDISTTMGARSVGSLVSFLNGRPDKSNYRRFRIKEVEGMDDFKMVAEVVRRRYGRLKREGAAYPDLVMIDGGKGQLAAAQDELRKLETSIPLISLAKREEEVFVPGKRSAIILPKDSLGLKLLQRVRDEAHRFAISYHRLLRDKKVFE
jgi:excinuclease ABC subunit C